MQKVQGAPCTDNANAPNTEASKIRDDGVGGTVMSDDVVMKVSQRRALTVAAARRDPVVRAGLDYIGGAKGVRDMKEFAGSKSPDHDHENLRGIYTHPGQTDLPEDQRNKVFVDYAKYRREASRIVSHELSHAASRRFWDDVEGENISPSVSKKLDSLGVDSESWDNGAAEEARNRLMDQRRWYKGDIDHTLEDFDYVRDFTHKGFNPGDTGERFRAARQREEGLNTLNDAMEEHFAKYGGGK
jgi:hypothetical protein